MTQKPGSIQYCVYFYAKWGQKAQNGLQKPLILQVYKYQIAKLVFSHKFAIKNINQRRKQAPELRFFGQNGMFLR